MTISTPANFVTLSGTVTQGGTPVSGINVQFNANGPGADSVTATTGSDGTYALHVIPGDVGVISFQMSTAQVGLPATEHSRGRGPISADYTVSAQDQTENLPLPTPTNVDVSVVDSDGTGLSGASVQSEGSTGNRTGQLSDGTPTIIQLSDYYPTCTTEQRSGQCSIPDLVGIPLSIYANYSPQPGDTSYPTFSGSTTTPVDTDPSAATVTISTPADFVTLSGTVTQGGTPVSGMNVQFNANGPGAQIR